MKRLLFGALLLLALVAFSHVAAHEEEEDDHDDDHDDDDNDNHKALMPTSNSIDEIVNTWSRKRKEGFVSSWENSEHDCGENNEHTEHCVNHATKIANLGAQLASMSMDLLNGKIKDIYDEMVDHAKQAAKSMGNSFKALEQDKEYMSMVKSAVADMGVGEDHESHEHDMMKSLLADHIEGSLNDHMHGMVLNYTKIYNSLPQTAKYAMTGNYPGIKDRLFKKLKTDMPEKYAMLKTRSAKTLKDAAKDMKSHALRYNRFATAFEAHRHK